MLRPFQLKGLYCHGCRVHFSNIAGGNELLAKLNWICLPSIKSNVTDNKKALWKTVRLTSQFKNHNFQSGLIFFKVYPSVPSLNLLCYWCLSLMYWTIICFTQFPGSSHCLNFNEFRDTVPFKEVNLRNSCAPINPSWRFGFEVSISVSLRAIICSGFQLH